MLDRPLTEGTRHSLERMELRDDLTFWVLRDLVNDKAIVVPETAVGILEMVVAAFDASAGAYEADEVLDRMWAIVAPEAEARAARELAERRRARGL